MSKNFMIADCGLRIYLSNQIRNRQSELRNQNIINEVYQADKRPFPLKG